VCSIAPTLNAGDTLVLGTDAASFPGAAWSGTGQLALVNPMGVTVLSARGATYDNPNTPKPAGITSIGNCQPSGGMCSSVLGPSGPLYFDPAQPFVYYVPAGSAGTFTLTQNCSMVGSTSALTSPCSFTVAYTIIPAASVSGRKLLQTALASTCYDNATSTYLPCPSPPPPPPPPGGRYGYDLWGGEEAISDDPQPVHIFEVAQSCSSARIQSANILNAALCQPLKAMPPYACSRTVRKPVLEIISLATGNALSAMGAYFALASMFLKWKLARDAERKRAADDDAAVPPFEEVEGPRMRMSNTKEAGADC
jgi:hypothetical protein